MKRISILLVFALIATMFSAFAFGASAAEASVWDGKFPEANAGATYGGGSGTEDDPWLISSAADLAQLSANVNANVFDSYGTHFKLTTDITLNADYANYANWGTTPPANVWTAIGANASSGMSSSAGMFKGGFDGNGHVIRGMYVKDDASGWSSCAGFFGIYAGPYIKNLGFENCYSQGNMTGHNGAGIVADVLGLNGVGMEPKVSSVYVADSIAASFRAPAFFAGQLQRGKIENCYAKGQLVIGRTDNEADGGGLVGIFTSKNQYAEMKDCYALVSMNTAPVSGPIIGNAGGIVTIENTYFDSTVCTVNKPYITADSKEYCEFIDLATKDMTVANMDFDANVWEDAEGGPILKAFPKEAPAPETQAPTTQAPTTQAPATQAPTTQAPATSDNTPVPPQGDNAIALIALVLVAGLGVVAVKKHR